MKKILWTALVAASLAAGMAQAQPPGGPGGFPGGPGGGPGGPGGGRPGGGFGNFLKMLPLMKALDANGDGVIDAKEIANAPAALKTLDKNKDGKLTEEELRPNFGGPGGGRPGGPGGAPGGPGGGSGGAGKPGQKPGAGGTPKP